MNNLKSIPILFAALLFFSVAKAGSGDAVITGESESGRTKLRIVIQDITGLVLKVELTVDGSKLVIGENCQSYAIADFKNGVYTISAVQPGDDYKFFEFWAIPSSIQPIQDQRCIKNYKFKAKINATEPRQEKDGQIIPTVELKCTLNYCI